jgi:hypothetical protein
MIINRGNVVPIFQTHAELQRTEQEAHERLSQEWEAAYRKHDMVQGVIAGNAELLAKSAESEIALAKNYVERHGANAEYEAMKTLVHTLKNLADDYNAKLFGVGEIAKRSMRFASAQKRHYYGPAATVTDIGGARK